MNDNLESLLEADNKYYKAEEKERNREYNQQRRAAQDRTRLQQQVHESIDASNKVGKGGNKKAVDTFAKGMAGILTAILAAYGIKKGMDHFGGGTKGSPSSSSPSGGGQQTEDTSATETSNPFRNSPSGSSTTDKVFAAVSGSPSCCANAKAKELAVALAQQAQTALVVAEFSAK